MDLPTDPGRTYRLPVVVVSVLVLLGAVAGPAAAAPLEGTDGGPIVDADGTDGSVAVVVGFEDRPAPEVVRRVGGTVTDVFDVIPAVAATVPAPAVSALEHHTAVAYVERDTAVQFEDTAAARGGANTSSVRGGANTSYAVDAASIEDRTHPWGVRRIGADAVQSNGTNGNGVTVAVLDSGIDGDHPALRESYAGGVDLVNDDATPEPAHPHGTHVAGTIAADADGQGGVGVAPAASIYDVKVLNETLDGRTSDLVAGIEWAIAGPDGEVGTDDDADVIVMSLGSFVGPESLHDAIKSAYEEHGVIVVAAAGNVGDLDYPDTVMFPARYPEVVSVGAVNRSGERPPWSGAGPRLELVAPGVDVRSTTPDGDHSHERGTSTAAPHVAGAAALVLDSRVPPAADEDDDGEWDATEVRERLRVTARDLGPEGRDDEYGHGLVDAAAAVGQPRSNAPPSVEVVDPADGESVDVVTVRANASDAETMDALLSVRVAVDGTPVGTAAYDETSGTFERRVDVADLADDGTPEMTVTVTDPEGATASDAVTVTVPGAVE